MSRKMSKSTNSDNNSLYFEQARLLIGRLERLSADSVWAHRASGVRGALIKSIDQLEMASPQEQETAAHGLQGNLDYGFYLLENAAREMLR
jgi:hypothetical protein